MQISLISTIFNSKVPGKSDFGSLSVQYNPYFTRNSNKTSYVLNTGSLKPPPKKAWHIKHSSHQDLLFDCEYDFRWHHPKITPLYMNLKITIFFFLEIRFVTFIWSIHRYVKRFNKIWGKITSDSVASTVPLALQQ